MKSMIDQAFRRYGMTVTVEHGAETGETHGFVQPVLCEGKRYRVRRAESVKLGALVTHYWAVLDREEETA